MHFLSRKFSFSKPYPNDLVSRYDRVTANWHASLQANHCISGYQQVIDEAINCFQLDLVSAPLSVLDAGAGTAGFSLALSKRLHSELAFDLLDPSPAMLNIAQQQLHNRGYSCKLIHGKINVLQHSRKRYDLILCGHVIEHCADGHAALQTLFRLLSDNPIIIPAVS
ncbi:MAG: class I SAM-dependent methyltransferase [Pseudomonadales bacterium]|nr:class I SAM-dependent methyltransferase [Pseudomonadales bacterium]